MITIEEIKKEINLAVTKVVLIVAVVNSFYAVLELGDVEKSLSKQQKQIIQKVENKQLDIKIIQRASDYAQEVKQEIELAQKNLRSNPTTALNFIINANGALNELKRLGIVDSKDIKQLEQQLLQTRKDLNQYLQELQQQ